MTANYTNWDRLNWPHKLEYNHINSLEIWDKQAAILGLVAWTEYFSPEVPVLKIKHIIETNPEIGDLTREQRQLIKAAIDMDRAWDNVRERLNPYDIAVHAVENALTYTDQDINPEIIHDAARFVMDWYPEMLSTALWAKTICGPTFCLMTEPELAEHVEWATGTNSIEEYEESCGLILQDAALHGYSLVMDWN